MNIDKHFQSYRTSAKKDALQGYVEFSKNLPSGRDGGHGSLYEYLNDSLNYTKQCIASRNVDLYKLWVRRHQSAMIELCEKMVLSHVGPDKPSVDKVFWMIFEKGWNWFKFSGHSCQINMTFNMATGPMPVKVIWVPRYTDHWKKDWSEPGAAVFDADELAMLWSGSSEGGGHLNSEVTHPMILFKVNNPGQRIISMTVSDLKNDVTYRPIKSINTEDEVVDWALPLF